MEEVSGLIVGTVETLEVGAVEVDAAAFDVSLLDVAVGAADWPEVDTFDVGIEVDITDVVLLDDGDWETLLEEG